jgi:exodeoxyribonuclease V beta subunit
MTEPARAPLQGRTLIEASAGTGKTHTITTLVLRLLLEHELDVRKVLVLTYTRAATAELRERIRRRIGDLLQAFERGVTPSDDADLAWLYESRAATRAADAARLGQALREFDEAPIFTIHGFCQRVLAESAMESRTAFDAELVDDVSALVDEVALDLWERATWNQDVCDLRVMKETGLSWLPVRNVIAYAVRDHEMPIVPERPPSSMVPDASAIEPARQKAWAIWRDARAEVIELLSDVPAINQGSMKLDSLRGPYARKMDRLVNAVPLREDVARFTREKIVKIARKGYAPKQHPFFDACSELYAAQEAHAEACRRIVLAQRIRMVHEAREVLAQRKASRGVQGFDDLLEGLAAALQRPEGPALAARIATRYPALLVDEFQDTDPKQYRIFSTLFAAGLKALLLIGDPKQAIYAFRGADVFAYAQAASAVEHRRTLRTNYRSDPALVSALNTLFTRARDPFRMPEIGYEPVTPRPSAAERLTGDAGAALQLLFVGRDQANLDPNAEKPTSIPGAWVTREVPRIVAREIVALLQSGARLDGERVQPRDLAVLCRTNLQGRAVQAALADAGVPAALDGDSSVFQSETADELSRVLAALAAPGDLRLLRAALATALLGFDAERLLELERDEGLLSSWVQRMGRANQLWLERGFVQAVHELLLSAGVHARLLGRRDGQRRLTDALHVIELLHIAATREHLGPLALVRRLEDLRTATKLPSSLAAESAQLRLESDEHAVRVTTVHRSKGLEYPIVFLPYLWTGGFEPPSTYVRFHDEADAHRIKLDIGSDALEEHREAFEREEDAEAVRLAYVALTRARHRCYVVYGRFATAPKSAIGGLLRGTHDAPSDKEKKAPDSVIIAPLRALSDASGGTIGLRDALPAGANARWHGDDGSAHTLKARVLQRALDPRERLTSFSRIAKEVPHAQPETLDEGSDRDARVEPALPQPAVALDKVVLADFPAGPSAGTLIHGVYERIDFRRTDPSELPAHVAAALASAQLDAALAPQLERGIADSLATPLDASDPSFTLSSVAPRDRVVELEFMLELHKSSRFSPATIASALERHSAPTASPSYPARVRELQESAAHGFLRGFIDLVFRRGERFYVVDYKSNHLGASAEAYAPSRLVHAMEEHHYFLQAHLYTLALHRYLSARLPGYDYERNLGGYYYLFVRGMAPAHPAGTGVLFERPARALVEDLSRLLGGTS